MIKIYLPHETRDKTCKAITMDNYPEITCYDTQYIYRPHKDTVIFAERCDGTFFKND